MQTDGVAVIRVGALRLRLAQADRGTGAPEVVDRLASLALDLADAVEAERRKQVAVERQAALDRRDDQVDMVNAGRAHRRLSFNAPVPNPARGRSERRGGRRVRRARSRASAAGARPPRRDAGTATRAR